MPLPDQRRPSISLDADVVDHVNCAASTSEPALRFRQDKINYVLEKTDEHDFS